LIYKILFFFFVFVLALLPGGLFVSIFLVALYYLPSILKSTIKEAISDSRTANYYPIMDHITTIPADKTVEMNSYSDDTLENMK